MADQVSEALPQHEETKLAVSSVSNELDCSQIKPFAADSKSKKRTHEQITRYDSGSKPTSCEAAQKKQRMNDGTLRSRSIQAEDVTSNDQVAAVESDCHGA